MQLVRKIDHCAIYVRDAGKAAAFYERLLEIPAAYQGDTGMGVLGAFFIYGDTILALLEVEPGEALGRQHVAFAVDDADATYDAMTARGFMPEGPPEDLPVGFIQGQRSFNLKDPDGALLEFVARPSPDPFAGARPATAMAGGG
jgi:catechol 2,3-dioxygenase-like lactoylglutathione lyase family enzyme